MLTRLEAEESMLATERAALAAGTLPKDTADAVVRRWKRTASPAGLETAAPAVKASAKNLRSLGVSVKPWPATAPPSPEPPATS